MILAIELLIIYASIMFICGLKGELAALKNYKGIWEDTELNNIK